MHEFISFDQRISRVDDARLLATSQSALYGKGVFTTIAIYRCIPFQFTNHWLRLSSNAGTLGIDIGHFSESSIKVSLDELIVANKINGGRARITLFDESSARIWPFESDRKTSLLITTADSRSVPDNFRLTISPFPVNSLSPLAGIKSCNYLEKLMAMDEAKCRGFDEAIRVNERGEVTSAVMANVFWLKNDELFTPSLTTGCLPGTTRKFVLENLACHEALVTLDELRSADAIFLTSAGLGVVQVAEFEAIELKPAVHPILNLLP